MKWLLDAQRRHRNQGGFTLLELLVACVVMSMIAGAVAYAYVVTVGSSRTATRFLEGMNGAQRIGSAWTKDVQSVDYDGVSTDARKEIDASGNEVDAPYPPCVNLESAGPSETTLVSFTWGGNPSSLDAATASTTTTTVAPTTTAVPGTLRTATWAVRGTGQDMQIVRHYCENGVNKGDQVLADHFAPASAVNASDVVSDPDGSAPFVFCPNHGTEANPVSDTCTITVKPLGYSLEVARRVPSNLGINNNFPPPPPEVVGVSTQNIALGVVWNHTVLPSGMPPVTSYKVYVYNSPTASIPYKESPILDASTTSTVVSGLINGQQYWVRTQAANSVGWGEKSPAYGVEGPGGATGYRPVSPTPDIPSVSSVTVNNRNATVTWSPPTVDPGGSPVTGYILYTEARDGSVVAPINVAGAATITATVGNLTNFVRYRFQVSAVNAAGEGPKSEFSDWYLVSPAAIYVIDSVGAPTGVTPYDNTSCGLSISTPCRQIDYGIQRAINTGRKAVLVADGSYDSFDLRGDIGVYGHFNNTFTLAPADQPLDPGTGQPLTFTTVKSKKRTVNISAIGIDALVGIAASGYGSVSDVRIDRSPDSSNNEADRLSAGIWAWGSAAESVFTNVSMVGASAIRPPA
ncbi:MAG: fibronectin type III domain-containing protein [Microthrixaceae bacterium]